MIRKKLGSYQLGDYNVRVFTLPNYGGGNFYFAPPDMGTPMFEIGLHHGRWSDCLSVLLHETFEAGMVMLQCAHEPLGNVANSTGNRYFQMQHEQFSELCGITAPFLCQVQPDLCRAYNAKKQRKKIALRKPKGKPKKRK